MTSPLIKKTAEDLAGAYFEEERSERFRKLWPDVRQFIGRNWPNFVTIARAILTEMLRRVDTPDAQKEEIYEALLDDRNRSQRRRDAKVGRGKITLNPDQPGKLEQHVFYKDH